MAHQYTAGTIVLEHIYLAFQVEKEDSGRHDGWFCKGLWKPNWLESSLQS